MPSRVSVPGTMIRRPPEPLGVLSLTQRPRFSARREGGPPEPHGRYPEPQWDRSPPTPRAR